MILGITVFLPTAVLILRTRAHSPQYLSNTLQNSRLYTPGQLYIRKNQPLTSKESRIDEGASSRWLPKQITPLDPSPQRLRPQIHVHTPEGALGDSIGTAFIVEGAGDHGDALTVICPCSSPRSPSGAARKIFPRRWLHRKQRPVPFTPLPWWPPVL